MKTRDKAIFAILIFSIGLTIGKLFDWGYFELSKDISLIDAITLFVTIGLGLYITNILEKEVQNSRIQKDLYISKLGEIEEILSKIEDIVEENKPSYYKIVNKIHICGIKRNSIKIAIEESEIQVDKRLNDIDNCIRIRIRSLKKLLTQVSDNTQNDEQGDVFIEENIVYYSVARITEIHTQSHLLKDDILQLKILLNLS